jgi:hypothetical protein
MALPTTIKNFTDGALVIKDGTGSPLSATVQYEEGNLSLSGLRQKMRAVVAYESRGSFSSLRHTNREYVTGSFSAKMTHFASSSTDYSLPDLILKQGSAASAISTLGSTADVYTVKLELTVEGTNFGDSADHTVTLNHCACTLEFAEGDPNMFTVNFTLTLTTGDNMADTGPKSVNLGKHQYPLSPPSSYALRSDAQLLARRMGWSVRTLTAVLGICSPKVQRVAMTTPELCGFDLAKFGGILYDKLRSDGISELQIIEAGTAAMEVLAASFVAESEVKANEDFFEDAAPPTST